MTTQEKINTRQATINNTQGSVNDAQGTVNDDQNTINEKTKVDISVRNFWGILIFVVGITSAYLFNNFRIASDIEKITSAQEKISINVENIAIGLEKHLSDSEQAKRDMRIVSEKRDARFNEIDKTIAGILARLQFSQ